MKPILLLRGRLATPLLGALVVVAHLLTPAAAAAALSPAQVAKRGLASTVVVRAEKKGSAPREASGFFVDRGVVATLASHVEGAEAVSVRLAGEEQWLEVGPVVARDKKNDLILLALKEKGSTRALSFAREDPAIGETVYAVAVPPNTKGVFHKGLVSGLVENGGRTFVQMDAVVPEGAEGGPLLDDNGAVAGVLVKMTSGSRFSFAVPGSLLKALKEAPKPKDPLAGVSLGAAAAWERGAKAERDRRWPAAEEAFREVLRLEPGMKKAEKHVARALAGQNRLPEAAALFIAYLAAEPNDHDARFELAEVQRKRGRLHEAFDLFSAYLAWEKRESRKPYLEHARRVVRGLTIAFERRMTLLPIAKASAQSGVDAIHAEVEKQLHTRLDAKSELELVDPQQVPLDALPKSDASCRARPSCIWKPAWSRWILTGTLVPPEEEGITVALDLELFDVRAKKRIATHSVRSQGGNVLPLDIDDGLAALMADMPPELLGTLKRGKGGSGRRPLLLEKDSAPPADESEPADEGEPVAAAEEDDPSSEPAPATTAEGRVVTTEEPAASSPPASEAPATSSPPRSTSRRSLRDVEEPPARDTRRIARVEEQAGGGFNVVPWLLITGGVTLAGAGVAFDLLSPTSADYKVGWPDFVGPAVIGVGAAVVIGGVVMGPFGGEE